jgi:hypothetical protein
MHNAIICLQDHPPAKVTIKEDITQTNPHLHKRKKGEYVYGSLIRNFSNNSIQYEVKR